METQPDVWNVLTSILDDTEEALLRLGKLEVLSPSAVALRDQCIDTLKHIWEVSDAAKKKIGIIVQTRNSA